MVVLRRGVVGDPVYPLTVAVVLVSNVAQMTLLLRSCLAENATVVMRGRELMIYLEPSNGAY
jgi:hypothetical protein